jgi:hypothetical protein
MALLHSLLGALPKNLRYRAVEVRLERETLYLDGQSRSHGDAEAIATALGSNTPFQVDPPKSVQRPEGGVNFTINGRLRDAKFEGRRP